MKKLLFILLFPLCSWGIVLPSHYGSEFGLAVEGDVQKKKPHLTAAKLYLEITSSKVLKDRLIITTLASLGQDSSDVGISAFVRLSDYLYAGGRVMADYQLDFKHHITLMPSFNMGKHKLEPYVTVDLQHHSASEFGARFYFSKAFSLTLGVEILEVMSFDKIGYNAKVSFPIHDFGIVETLWGLAEGGEDLSKEIKEAVEEQKK